MINDDIDDWENTVIPELNNEKSIENKKIEEKKIEERKKVEESDIEVSRDLFTEDINKIETKDTEVKNETLMSKVMSTIKVRINNNKYKIKNTNNLIKYEDYKNNECMEQKRIKYECEKQKMLEKQKEKERIEKINKEKKKRHKEIYGEGSVDEYDEMYGYLVDKYLAEKRI